MIPPAPLRLVPPSAIPAELREAPRWLAWKLLHGKKPPVDAAGRAMSTWQEPASWLSFADAKKRAKGLDGQAGVGFVLGDGFGGIDLDDCRDPESGDVNSRANVVVEFAEGAYAEVSPSGEGLKVFGRGEGWVELNFRDDSVAVDRKASGYFCVTGEVYRPGGIVDLPLDALDMQFKQTKVGAPSTAKLPETIRPGSQHDVLFKEACRHARDGKTEDEIFAIVQAVAKNRAPNTPGMRPWEDHDFRDIARSAARYPPAPDPYPPTESGDAEFFAARFAADLRFDHLRNEWLRFDGLRWAAQISGEVKVLAKDAIRARLAAATLDLDAPGAKNRAKWALAGESAARRAHLLDLAKNEVPLATISTNFDSDTRFLGAPNGVVDLSTGEVRTPRPEDHITKLLGAPWDLDAKSSRFDDVLAHALPDEEVRKFLQQLAGLTLGGVAEENVLPIIYGVTRSSKGTILDALASALGDYAKSADMSTFANSKDPSAGPRPDVLNFVGTRMVAVYEAGRAFSLDTALIKTLSGSDEITVRGLYSKSMTQFRPNFLVWFATDKRPRVPTDDDAYFARLCEIPFNVHLEEGERDPNLRSDLRRPEHGSAILAWAFRGLIAYRAADCLIRPTAVREAIEAARTEMNPVAAYIDEALVFDPRVDVLASELQIDYVKWCQENGERRVGRKTLGAALRERGAKSGKVRDARGWLGVGLREPSQGTL